MRIYVRGCSEMTSSFWGAGGICQMMTLDDLGGSKIFQMMTDDGCFGGVCQMMMDDREVRWWKKFPARSARRNFFFSIFFWANKRNINFSSKLMMFSIHFCSIFDATYLNFRGGYEQWWRMTVGIFDLGGFAKWWRMTVALGGFAKWWHLMILGAGGIKNSEIFDDVISEQPLTCISAYVLDYSSVKKARLFVCSILIFFNHLQEAKVREMSGRFSTVLVNCYCNTDERRRGGGHGRL